MFHWQWQCEIKVQVKESAFRQVKQLSLTRLFSAESLGFPRSREEERALCLPKEQGRVCTLPSLGVASGYAPGQIKICIFPQATPKAFYCTIFDLRGPRRRLRLCPRANKNLHIPAGYAQSILFAPSTLLLHSPNTYKFSNTPLCVEVRLILTFTSALSHFNPLTSTTYLYAISI
ncbi:hypothetical protein T05_8738 [Trichinella murrelli]|uniref:Uncharacterized protein n=1 Tax=Trichinella murrelli TaxID=144512 RepID=A0A0V0TZP6_9BILA|nr:hypothetical protein T05_8738 [Trichinella murrelli]